MSARKREEEEARGRGGKRKRRREEEEARGRGGERKRRREHLITSALRE
jgi:hypothetical protein